MALSLITGGAGHLGQALAQHFLALGDEVHIVDKAPSVMSVAAQLGCQGYQIDVTKEEELVELSGIERVDRLVCSVGAWPRISWEDLTPQRWRELIGINLDSAHHSVRAVTAQLLAASASIVFVGSAIALKGNPEMAHYAAAKAGLIGLAKSLALSMGPSGVRVNVVAPGLIESPDADHTWTLDQRRAMWNQRALRRPLSIAEVVAAIAFLSAEQASGITGQTLVVDGGVMLH